MTRTQRFQTLARTALVCSTTFTAAVVLASPAQAADLVCSNGYTVIECADGTQFSCYLMSGEQIDCTESLAQNTSACDGHGGVSDLVNGGLTEAEFGFECRVDDDDSNGGGPTKPAATELKTVTKGPAKIDNGGKLAGAVKPDPDFMKPCEITTACVGIATPATKQKTSLAQATTCSPEKTITLVGAFPDIPPEGLTVDNVGIAHNALLDLFFDVLRDIKRRGGTIDDDTLIATGRWLTRHYDPQLMSVIGPDIPEIIERSRLSIDEQVDLDAYECALSSKSPAPVNACEPKVYDLLREFFDLNPQQMDQADLDDAIDGLRVTAETSLTGGYRDAVLGAASVFEASSRYWDANGPAVLKLMGDDTDIVAGAWPWDTDGRSFCTTG